MAIDASRKRLAAVLSARVSSPLLDAPIGLSGEQLGIYRSGIKNVVSTHGGRLAEIHGDDVLAEFGSAETALKCALAIQQNVAGRNVEQHTDAELQVQIGVSIGDVNDHELGFVESEAVRIARALMCHADAGGVCISSGLSDALRGNHAYGFDRAGTYRIPSSSRQIDILKVRAPDRSERYTKTPLSAFFDRVVSPLLVPLAIFVVGYLLVDRVEQGFKEQQLRVSAAKEMRDLVEDFVTGTKIGAANAGGGFNRDEMGPDQYKLTAMLLAQYGRYSVPVFLDHIKDDGESDAAGTKRHSSGVGLMYAHELEQQAVCTGIFDILNGESLSDNECYPWQVHAEALHVICKRKCPSAREELDNYAKSLELAKNTGSSPLLEKICDSQEEPPPLERIAKPLSCALKDE